MRLPYSWKRGIWTEREQADCAAILYTICFSHPSVEGITWSAFSDHEIGCGLLRAKFYTKRAYKIVHKLIHSEWQTRSYGRSDAKGEFRFRGFYGRYRVTAIPGNSAPYTTTIHLIEGGHATSMLYWLDSMLPPASTNCAIAPDRNRIGSGSRSRFRHFPR